MEQNTNAGSVETMLSGVGLAADYYVGLGCESHASWLRTARNLSQVFPGVNGKLVKCSFALMPHFLHPVQRHQLDQTGGPTVFTIAENVAHVGVWTLAWAIECRWED